MLGEAALQVLCSRLSQYKFVNQVSFFSVEVRQTITVVILTMTVIKPAIFDKNVAKQHDVS